MPIETSFPPGSPVWVDLQSSDPEGAAEFYRALFDWELESADADTNGYALATRRGVPVAAIGPLPAGQRPTWTTYFAVDDIGAAARAAERAGGAVLLAPGELIPGVTLSIVADPAGAVLGLWQARTASPWLRDEPGAVDWVELVAPDIESVFPFYEAVLGVGASEMRVADEPYGLFDVADRSVAGAYRSDGSEPAHWLVYLNVADLDATIARATERGGALRTEPTAAAGVGRWAEIVDPQGATVALLEPEPEPA